MLAKSATSVETMLARLLSQVPVLERIADEQQALRTGGVTPQDSRRRLAVANRINVACQLLELDLAHSPGAGAWRDAVQRVRALAECVLRENPMLQVRGPLAVVRSADVPRRHVMNRDRRREIRKGYGLHRGVRNDEGPSVVVAFTPRGYEQLWHCHTVDEYTLALDTRFVARYLDGAERALVAANDDLVHFGPRTYHALASQGGRRGRTLTLKYPLGISVWLPGLNLAGTEPGAAEVCRVPWRRARGVLLRRFEVSDAHHRYTINLAVLEPGRPLLVRCDEPGHFYVLDGTLAVGAGRRQVVASADDVVVVDPVRSVRIHPGPQGGRLYWLSDLRFTEHSGGVPRRAA